MKEEVVTPFLGSSGARARGNHSTLELAQPLGTHRCADRARFAAFVWLRSVRAFVRGGSARIGSYGAASSGRAGSTRPEREALMRPGADAFQVVACDRCTLTCQRCDRRGRNAAAATSTGTRPYNTHRAAPRFVQLANFAHVRCEQQRTNGHTEQSRGNPANYVGC
jgi:hypothetical protein